MKTLLIICLLSITVLVSSLVTIRSGRSAKAIESTPIKKAQPRPCAVVELFTSEGCSSCPSAEDLITKVHNERAGQPVYFLSFHVDYWNRLGWTDPFSEAVYSARQKQYAQKFNAQSYTPQVIISGREQFVGSDNKTMDEALKTALSIPSKTEIQLKAVMFNNEVNIECKTLSVESPSVVNIALVQKWAQTNVGKGENEGKTLSHLNVVRNFVSKAVKPGKAQLASFPLPAGLSAQDMKVIAYIQNSENLIISSANSCDIR